MDRVTGPAREQFPLLEKGWGSVGALFMSCGGVNGLNCASLLPFHMLMVSILSKTSTIRSNIFKDSQYWSRGQILDTSPTMGSYSQLNAHSPHSTLRAAYAKYSNAHGGRSLVPKSTSAFKNDVVYPGERFTASRPSSLGGVRIIHTFASKMDDPPEDYTRHLRRLLLIVYSINIFDMQLNYTNKRI